jgi:hypothetical protein
MPTLLGERKATRADALLRASSRSGVVGEPGMHERSLHGNREISWSATGPIELRGPRQEGEEP